jgi:hypothetical protein
MATRLRDTWVNEFIDELGQLRPDLNAAVKFTHTVALHESAAHHDIDPREAARQCGRKAYASSMTAVRSGQRYLGRRLHISAKKAATVITAMGRRPNSACKFMVICAGGRTTPRRW